MKKLLSCICFLFVFGCAGYEPIFLTKDLNFYINKIENIGDEEITKKIIRNIGSYKLEQNKINLSFDQTFAINLLQSVLPARLMQMPFGVDVSLTDVPIGKKYSH